MCQLLISRRSTVAGLRTLARGLKSKVKCLMLIAETLNRRIVELSIINCQLLRNPKLFSTFKANVPIATKHPIIRNLLFEICIEQILSGNKRADFVGQNTGFIFD